MSLPITAPDLERLLDQFPDAAENLAALDHSNGQFFEQLTALVTGNAELLRCLAAIGRGVSIDEVKPGGFLTMVAAFGCLAATSHSPDVVSLVEVAARRLTPAAPAIARRYLKLVAENDR